MTIILAFNNPESLVVVDDKGIIYLMREDCMVCWGELPDSVVINILATLEMAVIHTADHVIIRYLNQAPRYIHPSNPSISIVSSSLQLEETINDHQSIAIWASMKDLSIYRSSGRLESSRFRTDNETYRCLAAGYQISYHHQSGHLSVKPAGGEYWTDVKRPKSYFMENEKEILANAVNCRLKDDHLQFFYRAETLRQYRDHHLVPEYSQWCVLDGHTDHWTVDEIDYFACMRGIKKDYLKRLQDLYHCFPSIKIEELSQQDVKTIIGGFHPQISVSDRIRISIFRVEASQVLIQNGLVWSNDGIYEVQASLEKHVLDHTLARYPIIYNTHHPKTGARIGIDVYIDQPFLNQLIQILPRLYRLGGANRYDFDLLDDNHHIQSYGEGASRHVCQKIKDELDNLLMKLAQGSIPEFDPFTLGIVLYVLNIEHEIRCSRLHAYFFLIPCESHEEINDIIRIYKPELSAVYLEYVNDPLAIVRELEGEERDMSSSCALLPAPDGVMSSSCALLPAPDGDMSSSCALLPAPDGDMSSSCALLPAPDGVIEPDEIKYLSMRLAIHLLAPELSESTKIFYRRMYDGFSHFNRRRANYDLIKRLSPLFYHGFLSDHKIIRSNLVVKHGGVIQDQSSEIYLTVTKSIEKLDDKQYLAWRQNITGCSWYTGVIFIEFPSADPASPRYRLIDESVSEEEIVEDYVEDFEEIDDGTVHDPSLTYKISTCGTSLTVMIEPDRKLLTDLFEKLAVIDDYILN